MSTTAVNYVPEGSPLVAVGLLICSVAGFQLMLYLVDVIRRQAAWPQCRPSDFLIYGFTALGVLCLVFGFILVAPGNR